MNYQCRIDNRLAGLRSDNSARSDCANMAAEADAEIAKLLAERDRLLADHARLSAAPKSWHCDTHGPGKITAWGCPECTSELRAEVERLRAALLDTARRVEQLKRECSADPESAQAVRNGEYMTIAYSARAAMQEPKS